MTAEPLVFVEEGDPGITRKRLKSDEWAYYTSGGSRITRQHAIDRLNAIALPPAYVDAWFSPKANGHILATGKDAKGRKQYRYHPDFRADREAEKFACCAQFGTALPRLRAQVASDLSRRNLSRERAIAAVVRLLDLGRVRVGNEGYAKANKSFGATTLRKRHARITGQTLTLEYAAKSGKRRRMRITDGSLSRFVRRCHDLPGQHLFRWVDADGDSHPVSSTDVNAYIRAAMGDGFTAKHFRTWGASVIAFEALAVADADLSLKEMLAPVVDALGNTPAIARKSYVHPALIDLCKRGQAEFRATLALPRRTRHLSRIERALIAWLGAGDCDTRPTLTDAA